MMEVHYESTSCARGLLAVAFVTYSSEAFTDTDHKFDQLHVCITLTDTDHKFDQAIDFYSKAIDLNPSVAVYYGNRSFAHLNSQKRYVC